MHNGQEEKENSCDQILDPIIYQEILFQHFTSYIASYFQEHEELDYSPHLTGVNLSLIPFIGLLVIVPPTTTFSFGSAI